MERANMNGDELVARLDGVRERGPGRWFAKCPAHEDRRPSLSVRELDDGTVLLHCFALCLPIDVCAAIGVELRDLFPQGVRRRRNDECDAELKLSARDALIAFNEEIAVAAYIAADMIQSRAIDQATWERLALAHRRISSARALIAPARLER
jgi:hypothetical protein